MGFNDIVYVNIVLAQTMHSMVLIISKYSIAMFVMINGGKHMRCLSNTFFFPLSFQMTNTT